MIWALLLSAAVAKDAEWGPWEDRWAPVAGVEAEKTPPPRRGGLFEDLYQWYRGRSDRDGARCPYYPTCSGYGITAVRTWGPIAGGMLTIDRLLREYPGMEHADHYPLVTPHEIPRLHDPVPPRRRKGAR
jgi:putative component of membrane protein insertase Oxa1/YidC/SpoIIIJ protein YidD